MVDCRKLQRKSKILIFDLGEAHLKNTTSSRLCPDSYARLKKNRLRSLPDTFGSLGELQNPDLDSSCQKSSGSHGRLHPSARK
mmetsp:Transcript_122275/g.228403  ORF Transcript_122275/g.228403 Transcript_122275/m.228403 type:complete len:83 (-) Transcript_122275:116-364(-)